jgi:hypothetical protein
MREILYMEREWSKMKEIEKISVRALLKNADRAVRTNMDDDNLLHYLILRPYELFIAHKSCAISVANYLV